MRSSRIPTAGAEIRRSREPFRKGGNGRRRFAPIRQRFCTTTAQPEPISGAIRQHLRGETFLAGTI